MGLIQRVAIVGAGNVASAMATRLYERGVTVVSVCARHHAKAQRLAERVGARALDASGDCILPADACIVAVSDNDTAEIVQRLPARVGLIVHTSGTVPLVTRPDVGTGVLYPFQTIREGIAVDWDRVPLLIESSVSVMERVQGLAGQLSSNCTWVDSAKRREYHLLGTMVNNLVNGVLCGAEEYAHRRELAYGLCLPLLQETVRRAATVGAALSQTGPAMRGDLTTLDAHRALLEETDREFIAVYNAITAYIARRKG